MASTTALIHQMKGTVPGNVTLLNINAPTATVSTNECDVMGSTTVGMVQTNRIVVGCSEYFSRWFLFYTPSKYPLKVIFVNLETF